MRSINWRTTSLVAAALLLGSIAAGSGTLGAAWEPLARFVSLRDAPQPASANVLSEHEIEVLDGMTPQGQAELLLERSINHYQGANQQIAARVAGWRGQINLDARLNNLFMTAINSDDQSGMFSAAQRLTAVPRLLDFAGDGGLDPETRSWVFQALRDITGQSLPHDAGAWRRWGEREQ